MKQTSEKRVAIAGLGNVGSNLAFHLAECEISLSIDLIARNKSHAEACYLDLMSALPDQSVEIHSNPGVLADADIVVLASGLSLASGGNLSDLLEQNFEINMGLLSGIKLKQTTLIVVLAAPVDLLATQIRNALDHPSERIIGFGGDIDLNRARACLARRGIMDGVHIIGAHGARAIPVLQDEAEYEGLAKEVRFYVQRMIELGPFRNLATGFVLGQMICDLLGGGQTTHYVNGRHPEYKTDLTWPFRIGPDGVGTPIEIQIGAVAQRDLNLLIADRK